MNSAKKNLNKSDNNKEKESVIELEDFIRIKDKQNQVLEKLLAKLNTKKNTKSNQ